MDAGIFDGRAGQEPTNIAFLCPLEPEGDAAVA